MTSPNVLPVEPVAADRQRPPFRSYSAVEIELKRARRLTAVQRDAPRHVTTFRRAYAGKSRRAAIKAFCVECMGYDAAEVKLCTSPACTLFPYRGTN